MSKRLNLNVPYEDKDEAKILGAKWDWKRKLWYLPDRRMPSARFSKWLPRQFFYQPLIEGGTWPDGKGGVFDIRDSGDDYDRALSAIFDFATGIEKNSISKRDALKLDISYRLDGGIFGYSFLEEPPIIVEFSIYFEKESPAKSAYRKIEKQVYGRAVDWAALGVDGKDYFGLSIVEMYGDNGGEECASIVAPCI